MFGVVNAGMAHEVLDVWVEEICFFLKEEAAIREVEGPCLPMLVHERNGRCQDGRGVEMGKEDSGVFFHVDQGCFAAVQDGMLFCFASEVVFVVGVEGKGDVAEKVAGFPLVLFEEFEDVVAVFADEGKCLRASG